MPTTPIYDANGQLRIHADTEWVLANAGYFQLVYSKRGHLKRAIDKVEMLFDTRPDSRLGLAFVQHLEFGFVYALNGVTGSHEGV